LGNKEHVSVRLILLEDITQRKISRIRFWII